MQVAVPNLVVSARSDERRIVYVGPCRVMDPLGLGRGATPSKGSYGGYGESLFETENGLVSVFHATTVARAVQWLERLPVDHLVLEFRELDAENGSSPTRPDALASALLDHLFPGGEVVAGLQRNVVTALIGGDSLGVQVAHHLGRLGIASVLANPPLQILHSRLLRTSAGTKKVAVCLAGGGIEGLFYELGVLRALDSFLVNRKICDLDLFCGISAGAVIGAFLANGVGPEEILSAFTSQPGRLRKVGKTDLFDPNIGEMLQRLPMFGLDALRGGSARGLLSAATRSLPSGAFSGARLRRYLRRTLTDPGMSDDFRTLRRPLLIGATDQDTSEAVLFGAPGFDHVPVHQAVRASSALVPFYAPEQIDGRWYTDGGFTRTTNMRVAVEQGATMVIVIDPLVPVHSDQAGYVRRRGGLFVGMQALKALINGRFDKAVRAIRELYPNVTFYLFRPLGDEMRALSGSPMKFFYRPEIEELAFHSTQDRIRQAFPDLARDFSAHGIVFRDSEGLPPKASAGRLSHSTGIAI